ncbi:MAG TPA: LCP family protein, partial [Tissierellaceae bacterium]|nr:LCP family protein [Tissierellaceae bacterium]
NKKKRSSKLSIFFKTLVIFILIFGAAGFFILNRMDNIQISKDDKNLGITIDTKDSKSNKVTNILLLGLDREHSGQNARSDSIMIASVDKKHKKIKLTSIMRDTYVDIEGRGMDKIGHAYAFGGPELSIKTVNQNFDMNIRDFFAIDFSGFESIIDSMGGVEIDVKPNEVSHVKVNNPGTQTLNGKQALAYSRIRKTGDGDYERTERQRVVLEKMLNKSMNLGVTKYPGLLNETLPYVDTSLSKMDILSLGTNVARSNIKDIEQYRIPVDGYLEHRMINGIFYIEPVSLEDNISLLKDFIYE